MREKGLVGFCSEGSHAFGLFVEVPVVGFGGSDVGGDFVEVVPAAALDLGGGEFVDGIEGGCIEAVRGGFGGERTDAGGDVENLAVRQGGRVESEKEEILLKGSSEENYAVEFESLF